MALAVLGTVGCSANRGKMESGRQVTEQTAANYIRKAIHKSTEGVVFYPSRKAEKEFDRVRMGELAQSLRQPAARCFLERAITRMEPTMVDGEPGFSGVPNGQAKIRARISPDGSVMATEVLETGFDDEDMENCVRGAIENLQFPKSRQGFSHHVDVIYWVSLGFHREANTERFREHMRREQTVAGIRAKACFQNRVGPGTYEVSGLNLFDRTGVSIANRVTKTGLPDEVSTCVATAFKSIRIDAEKDAFVRPAVSELTFQVHDDGTVAVEDEEWLRLLILEERALREERRAALTGEPQTPVSDEPLLPDGFIDPGDSSPDDSTSGDSSSGDPDPSASQNDPVKRGGSLDRGPTGTTRGDPSQAGTKLQLKPR
jgi:hypothetical protein